MNIKFELTEEQAKHLPTLQWLLTGQRGSGRTTLQAYVLIQAVLETGMAQKIRDHHGERRSDEYLAKEIELIINDMEIPLKVNWTSLILKRK